eukprot:TRINITY_DN5055_c0_g1_i1.p1 TRINITY_DN5055_c0_g1~~TRINITY_DN5055_c0_g1_i1.p1  ORF type:complete len:213 (+),score=-0.25 TRINITY_DN5055_c0_g1_i1:134-772(+)
MFLRILRYVGIPVVSGIVACQVYTRDVLVCDILEHSYLDTVQKTFKKHISYKDCFQMQVPFQTPSVDQNVPKVQDYAACFFTNWIMKFERIILLKYLGLNQLKSEEDDQIAQSQFKKGYKVSIFEVKQRKLNEILFDSIGTYTWLGLQMDLENSHYKFMFGSAIEESEKDTWLKKTMLWMLIPFHKLYSKMLLKSTVKKWQRIAQIKQTNNK